MLLCAVSHIHVSFACRIRRLAVESSPVLLCVCLDAPVTIKMMQRDGDAPVEPVGRYQVQHDGVEEVDDTKMILLVQVLSCMYYTTAASTT